MKTTLVSVLAVAFAMVCSMGHAESCSCTAQDGSCSANISCSGGCMALCRNGNSCSSQCSTTGTGPKPLAPSPSPILGLPQSDEPRPSDVATDLIDLDARNVSAQDLSILLSEALGAKLVFTPPDSQEIISLDAKGFPASELMEALSKKGAIAVALDAQGKAGRPRSNMAGLDEVISVEGRQLTAESLASLLSNILGTEVTLEMENPHEPISMQVKDMSVREILKAVGRLGALSVRGVDPADWQ